MEILIIPRTSIADDGLVIDAMGAVKSLQPEGAEALPMDSVAVSGSLMPVGEEYLFRGRISGAFRQACDRCLEMAEIPVEIDVMWCFMEESGPSSGADSELDVEQGEQRVFRGAEIDLRPAVWEELVFALPAKFVCREVCRGLCSRCGANLNTTACGCPQEAQEETNANTGLAGLAELLPDLARLKPKE